VERGQDAYLRAARFVSPSIREHLKPVRQAFTASGEDASATIPVYVQI
jgi:hypothetical protein